MSTAEPSSFLARNEFLIRRLHSLSGLIPVGAYMVVHLLTNSLVLVSPAAFQQAVDGIHFLDTLLPLVEWTLIFLPILFHAVVGVVIIRGGLINSGAYAYGSNLRYTMQRATGMIAFAFIMWHVFHMHGWFHFDPWLSQVAEPLGGARFKPYNATSTAGAAMQGTLLVGLLYAVGILSCVFHLANGIWTMGITWGVWTSPRAQQQALKVCGAGGVALGLVGLSALWGMMTVDVEAARSFEDRHNAARAAAGEDLNPHKLAAPHAPANEQAAESKAPPHP